MRTVKEYSIKKQNKKSFNVQWGSIYDDTIFPIERIMSMRIFVDPIQPMVAPTELPINYQHGVTEEINFPFWKIKVIFKNKIE
jgi:hypothetical protein